MKPSLAVFGTVLWLFARRDVFPMEQPKDEIED
jgi:hypothetical protein